VAEAIGGVLPWAVGVALSPVPIIAIILILGTQKARSTGQAFAAGWVVALSVIVAVVAGVSGDASDPDSGASTTLDLLKILIGIFLLYQAMNEWRTRPRPSEHLHLPHWISTLEEFDQRRAFALGASSAGLNPKNLPLAVVGAAVVAQSGAGTGGTAVALAIFVALASATVAGPVIWHFRAGERATTTLAEVETWLIHNNHTVMLVLYLVYGALALGDGIASLYR
jgi:threonine/homoserine/homoserine lactone efflux protein